MKLNEDAVIEVVLESPKTLRDYDLATSGRTTEQVVDELLGKLGQEPSDTTRPRNDQEVFRAAVRALGSNSRSWVTFVSREQELLELLGDGHQYDPAAGILVRLEELLPFFAGLTGADDAKAVLAWARLLEGTGDAYYATLNELADWIRDAAADWGSPISEAEVMVSLVAHLSLDPPVGSAPTAGRESRMLL